MKVLLACDKFKGSLTARDVNNALAHGILATNPAATVISVPVADGGDGTLEAALHAGFERHDVTVPTPTGTGEMLTGYARRGETAVVELADSAGLARMRGKLDPLHASTFGTGLVMREAARAGCSKIVLGVGGSASTDGGSGLLIALGAKVLDGDGKEVQAGGIGLRLATSLDLSSVTERMKGVSVTLATDVDNPLLGPTGAARTYAPQKGATDEEVLRLEDALQRWADLLEGAVGYACRTTPGAGAAGGAGFGVLAALNADCVPGIDTVLDLVDLARHLADVDLVITGEGSLDEQTLHGKAPVGVARLAGTARVPVVAVCGRNQLTVEQAHTAGFREVRSLADLEPNLDRSMTNAADLLGRIARTLTLH